MTKKKYEARIITNQSQAMLGSQQQKLKQIIEKNFMFTSESGFAITYFANKC